uniref:RNA polymerase sigma factor n=1 Tax=Polaribacter sp. TaxID=1920175 RepID=UPI00404857C9
MKGSLILLENEFIRQLKEGSEEAFSALLDQYQQKVFATCLSFVANQEDAEDVAQEVFLEVFKSISRFHGDSKLATWIYRISTTKSLEFLRRKKAKKRFAFFGSVQENDIPLDKTSYYSDFNHPGFLLENKEKGALLFSAISKLPKQQKIAFTLCNLDGKSYQEITEIMDKSLSSVESLIHRAKKQLQIELKNYYKK